MERDKRRSELDRFYQLLLCLQSGRVPFDLFKRACEPKPAWSPAGELNWREPDEGGVPRGLIDLWHSSQGLLVQDGTIPGLDGVQLLTDCGVRYFEIQAPQHDSPDTHDAEEEIPFQCIHVFNQAFPCRNTEVLGEEIIALLMPLAKSFLLPLLASLSAAEVGNLLPSGSGERKIEYAICLLGCLQQISIRLGTENPLLPIHFPQKVIDAIGRGTADSQETQSYILLNLIAATTFLSPESLQHSSGLSRSRDLDERCNAWAGSSLGILLTSRPVRKSQSLLDSVTEAVQHWKPRSVEKPSAMEYLVATEILSDARLKTIPVPESLNLELSMLRGLLLSRKGAYVKAVAVLHGIFKEAISHWGVTSFQVGIAAVEAINCYNILREEALAHKIATYCLKQRKKPELRSRRDWFYLELALVDSLIGRGEYEEAASTLQTVMAQPSIPETIHMMSCLRLAKVRRRLHDDQGKVMEKDGPLHAGLRVFNKVPEGLREEYLEEISCNLSARAGVATEDPKPSETLIDAVNGLLVQKGHTKSPAQVRYVQVQEHIKEKQAAEAKSAVMPDPVLAYHDDMPIASRGMFSVPHWRDPRFLRPKLPDVIELYRAFQDIVDGTRRTGADPNVFLVSGSIGVGKSSVVADIASSFQDHIDAILWVEVGRFDDMAERFSWFAVHLRLVSSHAATGRAYAQSRVLEWLQRPWIQRNGRKRLSKWLLVFDGVQDDEEIRDFWPQASLGLGSVIIITREPIFRVDQIASNPTASFAFKITPLPTEQATEFLSSHTTLQEHELSPEDMRSLAQMMGNLPSALARAASYISNNSLSLEAFTVSYEQALAALPPPTDRMEITANPNHGLALVVLWLMEGPRRNALLDIIAFLSPNDIPESLLWHNPACSTWVNYPQTRSAYEEAREDLAEQSLVWRTNRMTSLSTSAVIQDICIRRMREETLDFDHTYGKVLNMFFYAWPCRFESMAFIDFVSGHSTCSCLWPHALYLRKQYAFWKPRETVSEEALQQLEALLNISWCAITRRSYKDATSFLGMATFVFKSALEDPALELGKLPGAARLSLLGRCILPHHKGWLAKRKGQLLDAKQHFETCISQADRLDEPDSTGCKIVTAAAFTGLGKCFTRQQNIQQAIASFRKSIEALPTRGDERERYLATVRINLGGALLSNNQLADAEAVLEMAQLSDSAGGPSSDPSDTPRDAYRCYWLAKARLFQGKSHEECMQLFQRSLDVVKELVAEDFPLRGRIYRDISDLHLRQANYGLALEHCKAACAIFEKHDNLKPETGLAYYRQGRILQTIDENSTAASDCLNKASAIYQELSSDYDKTIEELSEADLIKYLAKN